jgi:glyoxylase-like metal-dependent hydrolase (beta-lactamase superfamily II)
VHRVTLPLPWRLDHVHCYAVEDPEGWTIVDSGIDSPTVIEGWRQALEQLGNPHVRRLVISHFHTDHIGASAPLAELTGASEIVQGREDLAATERSFGRRASDFETTDYLLGQGMPRDMVDAWRASPFQNWVRAATPTRLVDEGDEVEIAGTPFRVLVLHGHSDGHIVLFDEHDGRMLGGDVLLEKITPNVGAWQDSRPNPLGDYLVTLGRLTELAPRIIYPGHRALIENAVERAAETRVHHDVRLDATEAALRGGASTPFEVSLVLWPKELALHDRRFALGETLAHLIQLEITGRATEHEPGRWRATT